MNIFIDFGTLGTYLGAMELFFFFSNSGLWWTRTWTDGLNLVPAASFLPLNRFRNSKNSELNVLKEFLDALIPGLNFQGQLLGKMAFTVSCGLQVCFFAETLKEIFFSMWKWLFLAARNIWMLWKPNLAGAYTVYHCDIKSLDTDGPTCHRFWQKMCFETGPVHTACWKSYTGSVPSLPPSCL